MPSAAAPHARSARRFAGALVLVALVALAVRLATLATVAEAGANIDEVHHQRAFTMLAAQNVEIELVLQTRGRAHLASVLDALHAAGFVAEEQH